MHLDLSGQWMLSHASAPQYQEITASVPGTVYTDLLEQKLIDDPFYADNEAQTMWIGESDWLYSREFHISDATLIEQSLPRLVCEGLDTLCDVTINGQLVLQANNQFRHWKCSLAQCLKPGTNKIEILFKSPFPFIEEKQKQRHLYHNGIGINRLVGSNWVRKSQCNFGWDWGPMCLTAGICAPLYIDFIQCPQITGIHVRQQHSQQRVNLSVEVITEQLVDYKDDLICQLTLTDPKGNTVVIGEYPFTGKTDTFTIEHTVNNPLLWWPNGYGEQHCYQIKAQLIASGTIVNAYEQTLGLRTLVLGRHNDEWGQSFQFEVNGKPIFTKGANWIPADVFPTRLTTADYDKLLQAATKANMNMLRVWGGGIYEHPDFYALCDKYGILVWQDFMFACSTYPAFDEEFIDNVTREISEVVCRLRHHPSLALWCGNNELEQVQGLLGDEKGQMTWDEYRYLFDELIGDLVAQHDPATDYWPCSPHSPQGDRLDFNNPNSGDAHLWEVWHGRQPFEFYRTCQHRFNSEFGFQSFPEPRTIDTYIPEEEKNVTSYLMEYHQRSEIGNSAMLDYMLSWFRLPKDFDSTIWLSQILQGMAIKYAVEHWRRSMPRGMGTLYWQINDCWGGPSWSSIDYLGRWKALHYMAKRFYAPTLLSALEDADKGEVTLHLTNDDYQLKPATVTWQWIDCDGNLIESGEKTTTTPDFGNQTVVTLGCPEGANKRNIMLACQLHINEQAISQDIALFSRPKHLQLRSPQFTVQHEIADNRIRFYVATDKPALWVWCEHQAANTVSDQFFHLLPGDTHCVEVLVTDDCDPQKVATSMRFSSLVDTFR